MTSDCLGQNRPVRNRAPAWARGFRWGIPVTARRSGPGHGRRTAARRHWPRAGGRRGAPSAAPAPGCGPRPKSCRYWRWRSARAVAPPSPAPGTCAPRGGGRSAPSRRGRRSTGRTASSSGFRLRRTSSAVPRSASSRAIPWVAAGCDRLQRAAATVIEPARRASTKIRMWRRLGNPVSIRLRPVMAEAYPRVRNRNGQPAPFGAGWWLQASREEQDVGQDRTGDQRPFRGFRLALPAAPSRCIRSGAGTSPSSACPSASAAKAPSCGGSRG